jgi:L-alanine-DL-glutamate epimerase-like enolase superfamily enzyme
MIENARANNLKVMMGCMSETSIGISAIVQLLSCLDFVDMDSANLIANDRPQVLLLKKAFVIILISQVAEGESVISIQ